jgi:predicted DCC family thiol-disulfide oxidoreductase YuxK
MAALQVNFGEGEAPLRPTVLYDGHCRFCKAQMRNLLALTKAGSIEPVDFQEPGVLDRFRGLDHAACMQAMHVVMPDGRAFRGMEAAVRALATRPYLWIFLWWYYVPGIRQILDALYRWIANRRYRIAGKTTECDGGTCAVHFDAAGE